MDSSEMKFIYQDARGNITARDVYKVSNSDKYIQGICRSSDSLKTFRKDRVLENIEDPSNIEERLSFHIKNSPPATSSPKSANLLDVCFTGFKKHDKEDLIKLAEAKGLTIRSSVTKQLNFLCCGYNAGPSKIDKARKQGVLALNEVQFKVMLETGEIPED